MSRAQRAHIEAADWLIAQADGLLSAEEQAAFDAWLNESDGNRAAYWRLELGWEEAGRTNAIDFESAEIVSAVQSRSPLRRWLPVAIAASLVLAIGTGLFSHFGMSVKEMAVNPAVISGSYVTALGERQSVGLPDGSQVQLNSQSRMRSRLSTDRREVWLDEGEAFFDVARSESRPFVVHAGDRQITVLGTQFSVRRAEDRVIVAVLDGRVEVAELEGGMPVRSSVITGGDIAVAVGNVTLMTPRSDRTVEQALAWRGGMLDFDQKPLGEITAEFNRYNPVKLVLDGQAVGSIRITGTFPSNKPEAFARLLREAYDLHVIETDREIRISR